jgi:hypothetical protein
MEPPVELMSIEGMFSSCLGCRIARCMGALSRRLPRCGGTALGPALVLALHPWLLLLAPRPLLHLALIHTARCILDLVEWRALREPRGCRQS